jgi:hypothetical protein
MENEDLLAKMRKAIGKTESTGTRNKRPKFDPFTKVPPAKKTERLVEYKGHRVNQSELDAHEDRCMALLRQNRREDAIALDNEWMARVEDNAASSKDKLQAAMCEKVKTTLQSLYEQGFDKADIFQQCQNWFARSGIKSEPKIWSKLTPDQKRQAAITAYFDGCDAAQPYQKNVGSCFAILVAKYVDIQFQHVVETLTSLGILDKYGFVRGLNVDREESHVLVPNEEIFDMFAKAGKTGEKGI